MTCRICLDEEIMDNLIQPCNCTSACVHKECLLKWLTVSGNTACEICTFEYDIIDTEETKHTLCPAYRFSDNMQADAFVIVVGILGHFFIMFSTSYWGCTTEDMFIYGNTSQAILLLILYDHINPKEVLLFWKMCSSMCLYLTSYLQDEYHYVCVELIMTCIFGLYTYISLARTSKQTVRYINIEDRYTNEHVETVQGP